MVVAMKLTLLEASSYGITFCKILHESKQNSETNILAVRNTDLKSSLKVFIARLGPFGKK